MNLTVRIPDDLAKRLGNPEELEQRALEALVIEEFRLGHISKDELAQALGLEGLHQIDGFLKSHDVYDPCTIEDVRRDVETVKRLGV